MSGNDVAQDVLSSSLTEFASSFPKAYVAVVNIGILAVTFHQVYSQFVSSSIVAAAPSNAVVASAPVTRSSRQFILRQSQVKADYGAADQLVVKQQSMCSKVFNGFRSLSFQTLAKCLVLLLFVIWNAVLLSQTWSQRDSSALSAILISNVFVLFLANFRVSDDEPSAQSKVEEAGQSTVALVVLLQIGFHIALVSSSKLHYEFLSGALITATMMVTASRFGSPKIRRIVLLGMLGLTGWHSVGSLWAVSLMMLIQAFRIVAQRRQEARGTILPSLMNVTPQRNATAAGDHVLNPNRFKTFRVSQDANDARKEREREAALKKKVLNSSKSMSTYEKRMHSSSPRDLHASMLSDRPKHIRKLSEGKQGDSLRDVRAVLQKKHEQDAEVIRQATLEPILQDIRDGGLSLLEFKHNNSYFFGNLALNCANSDRIEKPQELVAALAENCPNLELIQLFSSSLEDSFLLALTAAIQAGKFPKLQEVHLENNLFTGKSLRPFFEAMAEAGTFAPNLTSIKLANQKQKDTTAEALALEALRRNPNINRLSYDWTRFINVNEANTLLSKNGVASKAKGKSLLSRSSSNSRVLPHKLPTSQ
eukprot:TRINITY_DN2783_c0_g1_i1.p1 TRINITY_DN2783_c0_g1~~TRINITY_DN2783_c0_g1_i1.p1  ORF type:complete len:601 (+),score=155.67 TRINITY_DN2783_c0_g1_i1:28-1803(+)